MIKDFVEGFKFNGTLMVAQSSRGVTNTGDSYMNILLQDSSGQIECKKWKATEADFDMFVPGNIILLTGEVYQYKDNLQMKIITNELCDSDSVNPYDYLAQPVNRNKLLEEFMSFLASIESKEIKSVLEKLFEDNITQFSFFPAASKNHHEYVSGLLHHTVSMLKIAKALADIYSDIDRDYLYAGIMMHDLGKTKELSGPAVPKYTLEGKLIGHISLGQARVKQVCDELNIEKETAVILQHLVLSHHGEKDFGSPVEPLTKEAELIYLIDNIDSKHNMIEKALKEVDEGEFTTRIMALDGKAFYKCKKAK